MIDINKPLKAKVFDADVSYHEAATMEVDVQVIVLPHQPYTAARDYIQRWQVKYF